MSFGCTGETKGLWFNTTSQTNLFIMSTTAIILGGFAIFVIVMLAFTIYELKHAYEVDPNDESFLD